MVGFSTFLQSCTCIQQIVEMHRYEMQQEQTSNICRIKRMVGPFSHRQQSSQWKAKCSVAKPDLNKRNVVRRPSTIRVNSSQNVSACRGNSQRAAHKRTNVFSTLFLPFYLFTFLQHSLRRCCIPRSDFSFRQIPYRRQVSSNKKKKTRKAKTQNALKYKADCALSMQSSSVQQWATA